MDDQLLSIAITNLERRIAKLEQEKQNSMREDITFNIDNAWQVVTSLDELIGIVDNHIQLTHYLVFNNYCPKAFSISEVLDIPELTKFSFFGQKNKTFVQNGYLLARKIGEDCFYKLELPVFVNKGKKQIVARNATDTIPDFDFVSVKNLLNEGKTVFDIAKIANNWQGYYLQGDVVFSAKIEKEISSSQNKAIVTCYLDNKREESFIIKDDYGDVIFSPKNRAIASLYNLKF